MAFNRDRNNRGGGFRPGFNDRGSNRGPVTMHKAVCDNCGKECEVPFRPTSGKPIFCSSCFEDKRGSRRERFEGGGRDNGTSKPQNNIQLEQLNQKLDKILNILLPIAKEEEEEEEEAVIEDVGAKK